LENKSVEIATVKHVRKFDISPDVNDISLVQINSAVLSVAGKKKAESL